MVKVAYEQEIKHMWDAAAILAQKIDDATEKDMKDGMEKGMEKGIEKGEMKAKIEVAKNLLKAEVPIDVVTESTGLSLIEIKQL